MQSPLAQPSAVARASRPRGIPEFSDLLLACRHRMLLSVVAGSAVAVCLAAIAWTLVDPRYQAEGLVRVREQQNVIFAAQASRAEDLAFFRSQAKLARSPQVLSAALKSAALKSPALKTDSVQKIVGEIPDEKRTEWLAGLTQVETESGSEVMSITVQHRSAELAHTLCNAVTQSYLNEVTGRLTADQQQRQQQLQKAAQTADAKLDELWAELNRVAQSIGSDSKESLTIRDEMKLQAYRDHSRQLQAAQLRGNQLQSQFAEQQREIDQQDSGSPALIKQLIEKNHDRQLSKIDLRITQMRDIAASPNSPQMKRLADQRERYVTELKERRTRVRADVLESLNREGQADRERWLAETKRQIELNRSEKEFLRNKLTEINPVVANEESKTTVPLDMQRHAIDRQSHLADSLWQKLRELQIESQSLPRVTLLEDASMPTQANHSRQQRSAAVAALSGLVLVLFIVGFMEWQACRVRRADDVASRSRFPIFGAGSSFDGTREAAARLFLRDSENVSTPVVMVTSCEAGEPRHLVSHELAMLLAGFGRRVLLINCDSNRSKQSDLVAESRSVGIRQLPSVENVGTQTTILPMLVPTDQEGVDYLPAGSVDGSQRWIDPRKLRSAITALRPLYDAIVVNGPSMMGTTEGLLLAEEVDTSAIAVFADRSRWDQLVLCEDVACQSDLAIAGSIFHHGKGKSKLKLRLDRPVSGLPAAPTLESTEQKLCQEVNELKEELRRARAGAMVASESPADQSIVDKKRPADWKVAE